MCSVSVESVKFYRTAMRCNSTFLFLLLLTFEFLSVIVGDSQPKCYSLSNGNQLCLSTGDGTAKTWQDAKTYCESQNGTLLNVVDAEIENTLKQFINDFSLLNRETWIGISAVDPDPEFHWINGQPISNGVNISNQSDSSDGRRFASVGVSNGQLIYTANTYNGNGQISFICEMDDNVCNDIYFYVNGKCYRKNETRATWFEASNYCLSQGGRLATFDSVSSSQVTHFLTSTLAITPNTSYWVGLINSWWKTTCGEDALYTDWDPDYPLPTGTLSNNTYSPCVTFDSWLPNYGWQAYPDSICSQQFGFICQQGTPCSPTPISTAATTTTTSTTTTATTTTTTTTSTTTKRILSSTLSSSASTQPVGASKATTEALSSSTVSSACPPQPNNGLGAGIGIGIAISVAVGLLVAAVIYLLRKRKGSQQATDSGVPVPTTANPVYEEQHLDTNPYASLDARHTTKPVVYETLQAKSNDKSLIYQNVSPR